MAMSDSIAVKLEDVSVAYRVPRERMSGVKEFAIQWLKRRIHYDHLLAVRQASFKVNQGELFGVIGKNGAGKSTLLKLMARVLMPTEGRVWVRGRVAPLLELGAGFHPELTGRENVYLYGTILGYSRDEMDRLFDRVVDFAELWDFIDAPLRTYSTGMVARLAFAVVTCRAPDILLVDEVLSVGDMGFQQKCIQRMEGFIDEGSTLIIVSHNMNLISQRCDRVLWLAGGEVKAMGSASEIVKLYTADSRVENS
jgi:ABC-type polysaccharide/polyol phosphate transport system ATPase subunit